MHFKKYFLIILGLLSPVISASSDMEKLRDDTNHLIATLVGSTAAVAGIGYAGYKYVTHQSHPIVTVQQLDAMIAHFPQDFTWGVSTSSTQIEEDSMNNSWTNKSLSKHGKSNLTSPGTACRSWTEWEDDSNKAEYLGLNAYRLSIEWSRVQPEPGRFDMDAINHYAQICASMRSRGIAPMVCLHHYSDPIWFLEQGGFTKKENIEIFTNFCKKMYEALRDNVSQWIVISQPVAYAVKSYKVGVMPPFLNNSGLEDMVMLNMFRAHMHVYDIMHNEYNTYKIGLEPSVGICHQIVQMKAATTLNYAFETLVATFADRLYNKTLLRFFTDGHFRSLIPMRDLGYEPDAPKKFDFFALSYYSPLSFTGTQAGAPATKPELLSEDNFRVIDKDGIYDAITQAAKLGKPVYIVESGITTQNENQRILLLNSYLSAISDAIKNKHDVRGYYYWTLMDNYEWGMKKNATHFGLYKNRVADDSDELIPNFKNHSEMLKDGGVYYKNIIARQQNKSPKSNNNHKQSSLPIKKD